MISVDLTESQARMLLSWLETRGDEVFHDTEAALRFALKRADGDDGNVWRIITPEESK